MNFWSVVTCMRFSCIRAEAFRTWKVGSGKSCQRKGPDITKIHMKCTETFIVYPFNCLSWPILTQRDEKYGYSVVDSRWCVRVLFLFMTYICPFIFTFMAYSPPYFSVNGMISLVLAYENGFKSKSVYYGL